MLQWGFSSSVYNCRPNYSSTHFKCHHLRTLLHKLASQIRSHDGASVDIHAEQINYQSTLEKSSTSLIHEEDRETTEFFMTGMYCVEMGLLCI